jgi:hypothetical protein
MQSKSTCVSVFGLHKRQGNGKNFKRLLTLEHFRTNADSSSDVIAVNTFLVLVPQFTASSARAK